MTIIRLGYVAMSVHLQNCSPSQTMTFKQFSAVKDREAAIRKLERIAIKNLDNCLRLLKHNASNDIHFFRLSSRLVPLANHEELADWNYMQALSDPLNKIADYLKRHPMRVDFHPDHFVVLNSTKTNILNTSIKTLFMHHALLKGMEIDTEHRCVLHVGGAYHDKEKALEQFIHNWGYVSQSLHRMILLENDDTSFTLEDTLYLCEKLGVPLVFDYHHYLANHKDPLWENDWDRIVATWNFSKLPIKIHISSPRSNQDFRAHADYVDPEMLFSFLEKVKGSAPEIHCMIEAKQKDDALFQLAKQLSEWKSAEQIDPTSFLLK